MNEDALWNSLPLWKQVVMWTVYQFARHHTAVYAVLVVALSLVTAMVIVGGARKNAGGVDKE